MSSHKDEFNNARKIARQAVNNNPDMTERIGQEFIIGTAMWLTGALVSSLGFRKAYRAFKLGQLMSANYIE